MQPLHPFQARALSALKRPGHLICVSPTGSGKSLIYETFSARRDTRTLLVTPLVALARQQHLSLQRAGVEVELGAGPHPTPPPSTKSGAWIVSPEGLEFPAKKRMIEQWRPNFLVVDECHCLWEWGETFRPSFGKLPELLSEYRIPRSLWLTATLPLPARADLRKRLPKPLREEGAFALPPKLSLRVVRAPWVDRSELLLRWIGLQSEPGMVFSPTREWTERLSRLIAGSGKTSVAYHAGMSSEERIALERKLRSGKVDIIVATSAFGMGMHYEQLRWLVLWQAPTSLLTLAQVAGRVGRSPAVDSTAIVLWDDEDFRLLEWTVQGSQRRREELLSVRNFLLSSECRQVGLQRYFDPEHSSIVCGRCDRCN